MKKIAVLLLTLSLLSSVSFAQFEAGKNYAGPALGLSFVGSSIAFGANYEYGMSLSDIGVDAPGVLGVGGIFRYFNYGDDFGLDALDYTVITIGAQGNYHFKLENSKIDPFLGITIGYENRSWNEPDWWSDFYGDPDSGGIFFAAHAGVRYFINPNLAVNARLGGGSSYYGALELGVDFKF